MKKSLVAMAALAATASFAQSSLTISGDIWAGYNSYTSSTNVKTNSIGNGPAASRLRFVGNEDMGGGMKANFWLEMQPSFGNGTVGGNVSTNTLTATSNAGTGALFNRGAWAGIGGGFGDVRIGRQSTVAMGLICGVDQGACLTGFNGGGILFNGTNGTGRWISGNPSRGMNQANGGGIAVSSGNTNNASGAFIGGNTGSDVTRVINAVTYLTPNWSGFTGQLQYAKGNLPSNNANGNGDSTGLSLNYANGPLMVGLAYQTANADARQNVTGKQTTFGGTYDFGVAKAGLIFQNGNATPAVAGSTNFTSEKAWALTLTAPMGNAAPYLRVGQHKTNGTGAFAVVNGADSKVLNLGLNYSLSKRTKLNFDYAQDAAGNSGLGGNTTKPSLAYIGVEHHF